MKITKPTLMLNLERVKENIDRMIKKAKDSGVFFRPHFKTHQSAYIGELFKEKGVKAITVSSLDMAEYFANNGWKDITVAFSLNINEVNNINVLAKKVNLGLLVENIEAVDFLTKNINYSVNIWLKIDTGYHRTGLDWNDKAKITKIIRAIKKSEKFSFSGFLTHSGHSYSAKSKFEIEEIYLDTILKLKNLQEHLMLQGFGGVASSIGDTPTCSVIEKIKDVDEIRPGNFVFYDIMQYSLGTCSEEDIAVALACPIIAKHPTRNELVIYGGAIHLSKESLNLPAGEVFYGKVAMPKGEYWGKIEKNFYVKSLTQEHGILHAPSDFINKLTIGDIIYILPIHSCLTANLMKKYHLPNGQVIPMMCNC